jgi:hypothetical protein
MTLRWLEAIGRQQAVGLTPLPIQPGDDFGLAGLVLALGQLLQMHLVGPVGQTQGADLGPQVGEGGVLTDAGGAIGLDGAVDDGEGHLRHEDLGLGDLAEGEAGVALVDLHGGVEHDQARGVDLDARLCQPLQDHAVGGERLAEGLLAVVVHARDQPLHGLFGGADGPHAVVDAAGTQTALDDLEAAPFAQHELRCRHPDVVEADVAVAVRGVVVAVHVQHAVDGDAGKAGRYQDDGLLPVGVRVARVRLAHGEVELAAGIPSAGRPPFLIVVS